MLDPAHVIRSPGPRWLRLAVGFAGGVYLAAIFLGSAGSSLPQKHLPRPLLFFTQVACLFPRAATYSIEYRATGFACDEQRYRELDYRKHFPIHADDKESRYHRVGHFYRKNAQVMKALEDYLVERHNALARGDQSAGDGIDGPIGGIQVVMLRIPFPEPGDRIERYARTPLADVPREWRKIWYLTPRSRRAERCAEATQ